ncbi:MAG: glycosyltransferase family 9 protein [Candidatus Marinimicrobia bacterium]|jgi:lipopolysaccharide heptosyltransferase II|nr:glycosyltransferase family 9 protein [Candidatus Neomarinimicrobiota bacterium]
MKKILIIRMSSIGDIVLSTSFLQSVKTKFPDSKVDFLIKSEFADIMRHHPLIDRLITFKKKTGFKGLIALGKSLRGNDYDMVYDIHSVFRTRILSFFLRKRFFKQIKKPRLRRLLLFYGYQNFFEKSFSHIKMYHSLLEKTDSFPKTELHLSNDEVEETMDYLLNNNIDKNYITIVPGAAWSQKQWSIENYNNLMTRLMKSFDATIVVLGATNDIICDQIIKHDRIINLKDKTSLRMAMGILKSSQHTIGSDTGLLHISEALDTPVTMILGPTSKETGARIVLPESKIIENKSLWCRPCSQNGSRPCYRKEQYCMSEIDSEKVFEHVNNSLVL